MKIEKFWSWIIVVTIFGMCLQGCSSDEPGKITYGKRLPVGTTVVPANYYEGQYAPMPLPSTLKKIEKESFYACKNGGSLTSHTCYLVKYVSVSFMPYPDDHRQGECSHSPCELIVVKSR